MSLNALILRPANPNLRVRGMPGQRKGNAVRLRNLGLMPRAIVEAALGAHQRSTYLRKHVVKKVTFHHPQRDQEGALAIEPGDALTRSTGKTDLHQERSGACTVEGHAIGMTSTALGADVNRSR